MTPERHVLSYIANMIRRALNYSEREVFIAACPDIDPGWKGPFICEVTPGPQSPYGGGNGSQDGGALLREQNIILWCFHRSQTDEYSKSIDIIMKERLGLLDRLEDIRKLFEVTSFPDGDSPTGFWLLEPVQFVGMSGIDWEIPDLGIIRRSLTLLVRYGVDMPESYPAPV